MATFFYLLMTLLLFGLLATALAVKPPVTIPAKHRIPIVLGASAVAALAWPIFLPASYAYVIYKNRKALTK